jgi:hypothetical protein
MFNKNDPLIDSVTKIMKENQVRRNVTEAFNAELGIADKKALPHEHHAEYDKYLEEAIQEALKGNQHKIDANKNNKIDSHDFKLLRSKKEKKPEEHGVEAEREMASKGQKMYEEENLDEASYSSKKARAGEDIGKPGKMFSKIASSAAKRYGSEERGKKVAGAILAKMRSMKEQAGDTHDIQFADKPGQTFKAMGKNKDDLSTFNKDMASQPSSIQFPKEPGKTYYRDNQTGDYSAQRDTRAAKEPTDTSASSAGPKSIQFPGSATTYTRNTSGEYEAPKAAAKSSTPSSEKPKYQSSIYPDDARKAPDEVEKPRSSGATYNPQVKRTNTSIKKALSEPLKGSTSNTNRDRLNERKMTDAEMAKREEIVKSMKKGMAGFKERYGERAKDVMYATATKQAMKEATDIDSIMEEIAHNLNEKAYKMLEAPFHEAAAWFNSLSEEQFAMLDEQSFMDVLKSVATGGGQNPSSTAPKPTTSLSLGGASKQASAPPVGAGPGSRAEPRPYTGIGAMGGQGTAAAEKAKGTASIATGGAPSQASAMRDKAPTTSAPVNRADERPTPTPAPSAPRTSERVASQQANVPDSRNLRTAVKPAAGEGATGKALAAAGVSRADRLNPAFLKSQGITAKPGSAEANMALRAKMQSQRTAVANAENPKSATNAPTSSAMRPGQNVSGMRRGPTLGGGVRE